MAIDSPPRPQPQDEIDALEALIREARDRQRRRRFQAATAAIVAVGVIALTFVLRGGSTPTRSAGSRPTTPASQAPRCRADQLRLTGGSWGVAAGSFQQTLTLTNVSHGNCTINGWPTVRRLDRAGRALPARTIRVVYGFPGARSSSVLKLRAGRAASFNIYGEDWNHIADRPCPVARAITVRPPGAHRSLPIRIDGRRFGLAAAGIPACRIIFEAPLIAGATDPYPWAVPLSQVRTK